MAQKKKSTQPAAPAPSAEEIASRLSDAQERIGSAAQEAEQRSEQTRAQLRETEESAQARMSESERQRSEAQEAAKSLAERKLAALSYAENYRERMQSERSKARKAREAEEARQREEAEARAREERQARIEEALRREQEEIDQRNARAEEMLRAMREKSAQPEEEAPAPVAPVEEPVEEPKEAPKAPETSALEKFKSGAEDAAPASSEPLTFDLSDLGLDGEDVAEDDGDDIVLVDENGYPLVDSEPYPPMMPPFIPQPQPQPQQNGEMMQLIGEMRAERAEANARRAEADARQAEAQRRSIEMMIEQENTRAEREERHHRENAEREERLARESRESLSEAMADAARRSEAAARGDGDARELAFARAVASTPAYTEPEQTAQDAQQESAPEVAGDGVPPMITIGGVTYEEDAEHQKRLSKAERAMQKRLRKQAKKEALAFIKEKKAENKGLRREIKEVRALAREDKSRQSECYVEELNIRIQIVENLRAMIDYAKEFKKNTLAREIYHTLKEEVQSYNSCYKRATRNEDVDATPIAKTYIKAVWNREEVADLTRARVIFLPERSEEGAAVVAAPAVVDLTKAIKKQAGVVDHGLVSLESAVKVYGKAYTKAEKARAKGKARGMEKAAEAMSEAETALTLATEDVDYAIADLASLYEEAIAGETSLSKKTRLEKARDKKLSQYADKKAKILSKLPTPPDGGGDTPADEDSVNFRNDTDGAAENAEGVRIVPVALPTTRDNGLTPEQQSFAGEMAALEDALAAASSENAPTQESAGEQASETPVEVAPVQAQNARAQEEAQPETAQAQPEETQAQPEAAQAQAQPEAAQAQAQPEETAQPTVSEALSRVSEDRAPYETVVTTVRPTQVPSEEQTEPECTAQEETAPALTRDELALRQFDAYNEAVVARAAGKAEKIDRKSASKQLIVLQKQAEAERIALAKAKEATKRAKKKKAEMTSPVIEELNARAALIETLSRIIVLSHALGEGKIEKSALTEMNGEVRAYNTAIVYLPEKVREGVSRLDEQMANTTLATGTPVNINRVRYEEVEEEPFEMLPAATVLPVSAVAVAATSVAQAAPAEESVITSVRPAAQTPAPVEEPKEETAQEAAAPAPTRDELALRQFDAYNEAVVARAAGKAEKIDRKSASKQLVVLQKQAEAERIALAKAKEATKHARKKKSEMTSPIIEELNARAALVETLSRIIVLSHALGDGKIEKSALTEMNGEVRAYNTSIVYLPEKIREGVSRLDEQLANTTLANGTPVSISRVRYEEVEEEPFEMLPAATVLPVSAVAVAAASVAQAAPAEERVITSVRSAVQTTTPAESVPVEEPKEETAEETAQEPKPTRDEIAWAQYDAHNDRRLVRSLAKADKAERKSAKKALDDLMKQTKAQRRAVAQASAEVTGAKKRKESLSPVVAKELSERASLIEQLATVMLLSRALGLSATEQTAEKEMRAEIKAYNKATRALSKEERRAVGELSPSLVDETLNASTIPALPRIRVEEPVAEEEFVMIPTTPEREDNGIAAAVALVGAGALAQSEIVLQGPAAVVAPMPVSAPKATEEAPRVEEKPEEAPVSRDEIALSSFDAYNELQYRKKADRLTKSNRKSALATLAQLKKESDKKRKLVLATSSETQKAKKSKGAMEEACALELNARSAWMLDLSKIAILAGVLAQTKTQKAAMDEITKQVRAYNSTLRLLPKAKRAAIPELSRNLASTVVSSGALPTFPTFRVDEGEKPIEMITYEEGPDALALALTATGATVVGSEILLSGAAPARLVTPVVSAPAQQQPEKAKGKSTETEAPSVPRRVLADDRAYEAYTAHSEAQFAREADRNARADRKSATAQISLLEKETTSLRREVQSASLSYRQAKKQKQSLNAPLARELNARADLVMALSRILLLANALGDQKKVRKTTAALRTEAQAYNSALRSLPKEQRKLAVPMDKNPEVAILEEGRLPNLSRMHAEEPEAEIAIIPSPVQSATVRQAMATASTTVAPEEFYIPSHTTVASAPARLSRKEEKKQMHALESQDTEMRRRLANAEASRLTARKAKQSTTAATVASLNARAAIIEINARMLALAKSQGLKKAEKRATRAIDTEVRAYNTDARALSKSERIKIAPLSEKLSQGIAQGVPMAAIPRIRLDAVNVDLAEFAPSSVVQGGAEDIVITRNSDGTVYPTRRGVSEATTLQSERPERLYTTTTQAFDAKQLSEYISKQQKAITALKKERVKEERRTSSLEGNERAASILRVRNATAKIIATQIDTISILRTESAFRREMSRFKSELTEEVRRYNKCGDAYKKVTGKKLVPLQKNLADRVARGMDFEAPRIADFSEASVSIPAISLIPTSEFGLATEPVYENLGGRSRAVSRAQRRAQTEEYMRVEAQSRQASEMSAYEGVAAIASTSQGVTRDYLEIEAMDRYEFRSYLKGGEKQIRSLRKQLDAYEKQNKKATESDTHAALVGAIVVLEREICEVYFSILKTGVATGAKHETKKYARLAKNEIQTYNRRLKELTRYTGAKYPQADASIPDKIVKRKAYNPMLAVHCELDPAAQLRREAELRRLQGERDARQQRIDSTLNKKQKRKAEKRTKAETKAADKAPLTKSQIKKYEEVDLALISARYEEELRLLEREVTELERQYTLNPQKAKKEIAKRKAWIRQMTQEKKEALRQEKQDNARYFALLTLAPSKLVTKKMTFENAVAYQEDLMQLMRERIALNERILTLYRGVEGGSDATAIRLEKMYLAAHNGAIRRYNGLTRKIRKLHITIPQKEQLFALVNQCAREEAAVKVERKKMSSFKLRGAARKAQRIEIRKAEDALRRTRREIDRKMRIRTAADRRHVPAEHAAVWFFVLVAVALAAFMVWVFRVPIWEGIKTLVDMLSQGNVTGG